MATALDRMTGWTLRHWRNAYERAEIDLSILFDLRAALSASDSAWIHVATARELELQLDALTERIGAANTAGKTLPLHGVPFAVKDNIDVRDFPTTAACPEYSHLPTVDATVVAKLREAGAIVLGKTNLDQFATGLVGVRSPYGIVPSSFSDEWIGGGSSSGSASVVARGLVPFSLGTDTAGSGRVPAAFNNVVGLKPTRGRFSNRGVVPACRTLDCVSVFALTVDDAAFVAALLEGRDPLDPYSRPLPDKRPSRFANPPRLAIPRELEFFDDDEAREVFESAREHLLALGAVLEPIDFEPFRALAALLYQGPWVAERTIVIERLLATQPEAIHPVVRGIIEGGAGYTAIQAFRAEYERAELARRIASALEPFDALVVPTTPTIYRVREVEADPVAKNSRLGTYTNFTNLADLSALALPSGFRKNGLPAGITLLAPAFHDDALADFGRRFQARLALPLGATGLAFPAETPALEPAAPPDLGQADEVLLAVVGAHLTGLPLNHELTTRGARLVETTRSAANYRLFALPDTTPPKPGLVRSKDGAPIEVEVWGLSVAAFGSFVVGVPRPLGIGNVELADGRTVKGFICEPSALDGALDITRFGGFRAYLLASSP